MSQLLRQRYFVLNKPYNMLSQFIGPADAHLLSEVNFNFPLGTHPIGRLDGISEGLLILTTNKKVTRQLFFSKIPHKRHYLVQVYKIVSQETLAQLRTGVLIQIRGNEAMYLTAPCEVEIVDKPTNLFQSGHEFDDKIPHTWLLLTLTEGKFRQIRKMMKAVKHRCQRLIRVAIEDLALDGLLPGEVREIAEDAFFEKLKIDKLEKLTG
ncbi:MAG: pseudouridine synthase [Spirosomataceae bacterium]